MKSIGASTIEVNETGVYLEFVTFEQYKIALEASKNKKVVDYGFDKELNCYGIHISA